MAVILVIAAIIATIVLISMSGKPAPFWFSDDWTKREPITISNYSDAALDNYQVKIVAPYDDDMQTDFGDLRFTLENGDEIPYWIESYSASGSAIVWVKVPTIQASATTTIYVYYGNSGATSASSGTETFVFFDDFLTDTWTDSRGAWIATTFDGKTVLQSSANGGSANQVTYKNVGGIGSDWAVELYTYWDSPSGSRLRIWDIGVTDPHVADPVHSGYQGISAELYYGYTNQHMLARRHYPDILYPWEEPGFDGTLEWMEPGAPNKNTWARQTFKKFGENFSFTDSVTVTGTDSTPLTSFAYLNLTQDCDGAGSGGKVNVDWILLRKYTPTEPILDIGAETSRGIEIDTSFLGVAIAVLWASIIAIIYLILRSLKQH